MTIGVVCDAPGITQAHYDAVTKYLATHSKFRNNGWQYPGIITHFAGPTETGWRIVDVWETEEAFERFNAELLQPALKEAGIINERPPHIFQIYNFVSY